MQAGATLGILGLVARPGPRGDLLYLQLECGASEVGWDLYIRTPNWHVVANLNFPCFDKEGSGRDEIADLPLHGGWWGVRLPCKMTLCLLLTLPLFRGVGQQERRRSCGPSTWGLKPERPGREIALWLFPREGQCVGRSANRNRNADGFDGSRKGL